MSIFSLPVGMVRSEVSAMHPWKWCEADLCSAQTIQALRGSSDKGVCNNSFSCSPLPQVYLAHLCFLGKSGGKSSPHWRVGRSGFQFLAKLDDGLEGNPGCACKAVQEKPSSSLSGPWRKMSVIVLSCVEMGLQLPAADSCQTPLSPPGSATRLPYLQKQSHC